MALKIEHNIKMKSGRIPAVTQLQAVASSIFNKMALRIAVEWIIEPEWYEVRKNSGCGTIASSIFMKMALKIEHDIKTGRIMAVKTCNEHLEKSGAEA